MTDDKDKQREELRKEMRPRVRDEDAVKRKAIDLSKPMQQHILAAVLRIPGLIARARPVLNPDYFEDDAVSDLIASVNNHWDEDKEVPSRASLLDKFPEATHNLIRRVFKEEIPDPSYTIQRIREFAQVRAMHLAILKGAQVLAARKQGLPYRDEATGKELDLDPVDLVKEAALVGSDSSDMGLDLHATLEDGLRRIIHPEEVEKFGFGEAMAHMNAAGVQLERGELGCVLGASKRGKSHVLNNIAYGALNQGKRVIYYSLEMKAEKVRQRMYARIAGESAPDVRQDPHGFVACVRRNMPKLVDISSRFLIKRYPAGGATPDDIRAHLTQCVAEGFKPDLIIIDYAGLMRPKKPTGEKRHDMATVFLEARAIAGEFDVAVWTAAQANRGAVNKPVVTMADFAECFEIVQHLDVGFSICMTDEEKAANQGRFFILASRNDADGGYVEFKFNFAKSIITTTSFERSISEKRSGDRSLSKSEQNEEALHQENRLRKIKAQPPKKAAREENP